MNRVHPSQDFKSDNVRNSLFLVLNPLSANRTKWSNTLKQFVIMVNTLKQAISLQIF